MKAARRSGTGILILILALLAAPLAVQAQQARAYRIGVVHLGGPYSAAVDGLRDGLNELGLEEGKQLIFHVRDVKGDPKSVEAAARSLEREKVDLIFSVATSVTIAVKRATQSVPIVFYAGTDPVEVGLVKSFAKPGGRLTGIHSRSVPLVAKRLQLLKEMIPAVRRVVYFYNPGNPINQQGIRFARDAARKLKVELVERQVGSVEELRAGLDALQPGEADALTYVDGMVTSQEEMVIDAATKKKLAIVVGERTSVAKGALASYGVSYYTNGRLAAKLVQRVLQGASPADMPVEQVDRLHFVVNLKTAKALGLRIPPSVMIRADEVIE